MTDRYFDCYVLPSDDDVVFVGLHSWIEVGDNSTPMLGTYLCDEAEVNQRCDALEADLKRLRRTALAKIAEVQRQNAQRTIRK